MIRKGLLHLAASSTARKVLTGTPVTRSMSRRFVAGETVGEFVAAVRSVRAQGMEATANYLGESVRSREGARASAEAYLSLLDTLHRERLPANCSLKFTQLGQDISEEALAENLAPVLERARETGAFLRFDMESSAHTDRTLTTFETLWAEGWRGIGVVLQAYLKRTPDDVRRMVELGAPVRLCKGAYRERPEVAFQEMPRIREAFLTCLRPLLTEGEDPAIATHDEWLIRKTREMADQEGVGRERFEFQLLYGVRRDLQRALVAEGYRVRVYIPYGGEWYPYLMRRLAERPENLALVMGSMVRESPVGSLWRNLQGQDAGGAGAERRDR
jgi:proline dehydrogenase